MFTLPHVHLLLNHVPTVGTAIAIALLILTLVRKHDALRRVSLELFCVIALVTIPAYIAGVGARVRMIPMGEVSEELIQRHHDAAVPAMALMLLTGGLAWVGLWQFRRAGRQSTLNVGAVLLLGAMTMAAMARTATLGGEIRHPEILFEEIYDPAAAAAEAAEAAAGPGWWSAAAIADAVNGRVWLWPAMETLHFIGLWLLFGVLLVVNARMFGWLTQVPFSALHRLLPWAMLGLLVNTLTGLGFIIALPDDYFSSTFYWKIGLLVVGGINLVYLTVFDGPWSVGAGQRAPARVVLVAVSTIAIWIGVMFFGRMLPFLGEAF
jgi:uncharacterized membrane protein